MNISKDTAKITTTTTIEDAVVNNSLEPENEIMELSQVKELIDSIIDLIFLNTPNGTVFMPVYIDILMAYWKIGFFYPSLEVAEKGVDYFFGKWINGEYDALLEKLEGNKQAQTIDSAIKYGIEFKKAQLQQPIVNSIVKFVDLASVIAQKYVDDIDNIGSKDIKGFLERFMQFTSTNNVSTITDEVLKRHGAKIPASTKKKKSAVAN